MSITAVVYVHNLAKLPVAVYTDLGGGRVSLALAEPGGMDDVRVYLLGTPQELYELAQRMCDAVYGVEFEQSAAARRVDRAPGTPDPGDPPPAASF